MSKNRGVMDVSSIHKNYLSRSSKGRQVMAGSLTMLGGLDVSGLSKFKNIETDGITSGSLSASGTITGNLFSGSGASLTNIPATSLTGTINQARLSSNVMLTNKAQTVTSNLTMSSAANLYFAGGSSYWVNNSGSARFNALTTVNNVTISGNAKIAFTSNGVGGPGTSGVKLDLLDNRYTLGVESNTLWYDANATHKFYTGGSAVRATIDSSGITSEGDLVAKRNLDVQGEVMVGGRNRFPDPLCATGGIGAWSGGVFERVQKPFDEVAGSIRLTSTSASDLISYDERFDTAPGETQTFSAYVMATTASKEVGIYIQYFNASGSAITNLVDTSTAPTRWGRISTTQTAPPNSVSLRVRVGNRGGSGTVMYFAGFQLEHGSAMTPFKPFSGAGDSASFTNDGIMLGNQKGIHSAQRGGFILRTHAGNGSVELNADGNNLHLGYNTTSKILLNTNLWMANGTSLIANTAGTLYYQGKDIDTMYLNKNGDAMSGDLTISKSNAWLTLNSPTTGGMNTDQAAGISIGESGYKGGAAMHITYTGDGRGHIGMNSVDTTTGRPTNQAIELYYLNRTVKFFDTPNVNGHEIWHKGIQGSGSGMDADLLDGNHASAFVKNTGSENIRGNYTFSSTDSAGNYNTSAIEIREVNLVSSSQSSSAYAPALSFHWGGRRHGQLALESNGVFTLRDGTSHAVSRTLNAGNLQVKGDDVWHKGNDGAGSGLDADLLDGKHHDEFLATNPTTESVNVDSLTLGTKLYVGSSRNWTNRGPSGNNASALLSINTHNGTHYSQLWFDTNGNDFYHRGYSSPIRGWSKVWTESNDGPGSTLDADTVDGKHLSQIVEKSGDSMTGDLSFSVNNGVRFAGGGRIFQNSTSDSWIRISNGLFGSSNIIRTDGSLQVGSSGSNFLASGSTFSVRGSSIYTDTQGRVSINEGSTNEHALNVRSSLSYSGINIKVHDNSSTSGLSFMTAGGNYNWLIGRDGAGGSNPDLVFNGGPFNGNLSALPERVRFTNSGRLGVGISNPAEMIHTSGNVQGTELVMGHPDNNQRRASWRYDNSHSFGGSAWAYIFKDDQNNRERIYIQQTGSALANMSFNANVSIGSTNTNPSSPLYIDHNGADGHITLNRSSGVSGQWTMGMPNGTYSIGRGANPSTAQSLFHIETGGNVGIGLDATGSAAQSKLHVDGRTESNAGFKTGNFEIVYDATEESLDFVFVG